VQTAAASQTRNVSQSNAISSVSRLGETDQRVRRCLQHYNDLLNQQKELAGELQTVLMGSDGKVSASHDDLC
jgi:hypothetical protein